MHLENVQYGHSNNSIHLQNLAFSQVPHTWCYLRQLPHRVLVHGYNKDPPMVLWPHFYRYFWRRVLVQGYNKDPPMVLGPHFYHYFWRRVLVGSDYS